MKDILGSGCGKVGSAVASKTREPGFESYHWEFSLNNYLLLTVCRKDENKSKRGRGSRLFLKKVKDILHPIRVHMSPPFRVLIFIPTFGHQRASIFCQKLIDEARI